MSGNAGLVAQGLRAADQDRYLSTLYAPSDKRAALTALYAFNAEIASIRDRVSEPLPGEVRLQWWRDVLAAGTVEAAAGHPIASELIAAVNAYKLPVAALQAMLNAREFDLYDDPMPSRADLEGYLGETASALIQLGAIVLDSDEVQASADAAGHAGCAQGIAGIIRLLPLHRARGQCYIPADILAAVGTSRDALLAGDASAARAVEAMAAFGRHHQSAFEALAGKLQASLKPAFLPAALTPAYLNAAEKAGANALTRSPGIAAWRRQWIMFRAVTGKL